MFFSLAAALATANETPSVAFAPNLDLFNVPSIEIINLSILFCSKTDRPITSLVIILFTLLTALPTPFP